MLDLMIMKSSQGISRETSLLLIV